jgi:tRNA-splicing ligase RtcB
MDNWVQGLGVELRGGDVDESPQAYRRLNDVLRAHEGTLEVMHTLTPIGVAMAGVHDVDIYKD